MTHGACAATPALPDLSDLLVEGERSRDEIVALRRRLHRRPEIGLDLPQTQAAVLEALDGLDLEVTVGQRLRSVVAVLRGGQPGPSVLLRADMDALPVGEETGLDFASEHDGVMHACGHDVHTAMLVGAARLLAARRQQLAGNVVFMFQPGEEGHDGARLMIEEGVLDAAGERVRAAYGMHVRSSGIPSGLVTTRPGTFMAAYDDFTVVVYGPGGHGSAPHLTRDPIAALAAIVTTLQTMVTRRFNVFDPVVLSVGVLSAGSRSTIIPGSARLEGTIRTFSAAVRRQVAAEVERLCHAVAAAHGVTADVMVTNVYPTTVNDPEHAEFVADTAIELFGADAYQPMASPSGGAEDFSRVLDEVPGAYLFLGAAVSDDPARWHDNHSSRAVFDEAVIPMGVALHAALAIRALDRLKECQ